MKTGSQYERSELEKPGEHTRQSKNQEYVSGYKPETGWSPTGPSEVSCVWTDYGNLEIRDYWGFRILLACWCKVPGAKTGLNATLCQMDLGMNSEVEIM